MNYYVYAIYNQSHKKIYIGQTINLEERLRLHNNGNFKNCYTSRFNGEWVLIFSEMVENRQQALKREKQLKSYRGREFIKHKLAPLRGSSTVERLTVNQ
jgi:putative endonuclease